MRETIMTLVLIGVLFLVVAKGLELWHSLRRDIDEIKDDKEGGDTQ
jgi:hypothetical protein